MRTVNKMEFDLFQVILLLLWINCVSGNPRVSTEYGMVIGRRRPRLPNLGKTFFSRFSRFLVTYLLFTITISCSKESMVDYLNMYYYFCVKKIMKADEGVQENGKN